MVRELRELVETIANIDTTVDIEDIKAVASFSPDVDTKIKELRDFLTGLKIKPSFAAELITGETVTVTEPLIVARQKQPEPAVEQTAESESDTETIAANEDCSFPELVELGLSEERIAELYKLYKSRKNSRKMSFVTCIKCCKFIEDKINSTKIRLMKVKVVPVLKEYLKMIDPDTEYNLCNIHDFLKGSALGCISKQFFTFKDGYLLKAS
jgi:hypothetical protein